MKCSNVDVCIYSTCAFLIVMFLLMGAFLVLDSICAFLIVMWMWTYAFTVPVLF